VILPEITHESINRLSFIYTILSRCYRTLSIRSNTDQDTHVRLLLNAKRLVVCFCVTALALMSSAGLADLIQIDDLGESIAVSFTSTGFGSIGTITNTGERVVIPYRLIGS